MARIVNREETLASLEHLAAYGRTALELLAWESMRQVTALTAEVAALKAVVDADIKVADSQQHADTMLFASLDISASAEISYAAAVAVQREALAHYRQEHAQ